MLGLTVSMKMTAKENAPRWFEYVLKTEDNPVRMALSFEERGRMDTQRAYEREKLKIV